MRLSRRPGSAANCSTKASDPKKPCSSAANATKITEWTSSARLCASARATSTVTAGPEALSLAASKTVPSGSVPTPSRCPPTTTARFAASGSLPRRRPTTFMASTSRTGVRGTATRRRVARSNAGDGPPLRDCASTAAASSETLRPDGASSSFATAVVTTTAGSAAGAGGGRGGWGRVGGRGDVGGSASRRREQLVRDGRRHDDRGQRGRVEAGQVRELEDAARDVDERDRTPCGERAGGVRAARQDDHGDLAAYLDLRQVVGRAASHERELALGVARSEHTAHALGEVDAVLVLPVAAGVL